MFEAVRFRFVELVALIEIRTYANAIAVVYSIQPVDIATVLVEDIISHFIGDPPLEIVRDRSLQFIVPNDYGDGFEDHIGF